MSQATRSAATSKISFVATARVFLVLGTGCGGELPEYFGPLCDKAASGDWSPAVRRPELDHIDYVKWVAHPELETQLLAYGMDDQWERLSGSDVDEDGIVVSPYGKTLNAYELIVMTPGLEGWGDYVRQHTYPVHGSCGQMKPGVVAHTHSGKSGYRTDVFEMFYDRDVVSRAGFLVHEVGHAAGLPCHVGQQDRSWEDGGTYRLQLEFLAAVYHAEGSSTAHKSAARAEFNWIARDKFVEATDLSLKDFE
jgi:hypothetical protein